MPRTVIATTVVLAALTAVPAALAQPSQTVPNVPPPPCLPAALKVTLVNPGAYSPSSQTGTAGSGAMWQWNNATESATSTGLTLFNSGVKSSGSYSFTFWGAGTYTYDSTVDTAQKGSLKMKMCDLPTTAKKGSVIWMEPQTVHHPNWVEDVEVKKPGAATWSWAKYGATTQMVSYTPALTGTYSFRSRLRRTTTGKVSGFSPIQTVRVS